MAVDEIIRDDRALAEAAEKVRAAQDVMERLVEEDPERVWTARELQERTAEEGPWSSSVLSLAFLKLVKQGVLVLDDESLEVRSAAALA
jgi:hypothetical protein